MRIPTSLFLSAALLCVVTACHRKDTSNKVLDGFPVGASQGVILPAAAAQELFLMQRDAMGVVVPVINKIGLSGVSFSEIQGPNAQMQYTFSLSERHYGTAHFSIQFFDIFNNVIDPISNQLSTATLSGAIVTIAPGNGSSALFNYTETVIVALTTPGTSTSAKNLTGTTGFIGNGYSLTFTYSTPGPVAVFDGLTSGNFTATGSGGAPSQQASLMLNFNSNHEADGNIAWEGKQGGIHFKQDGSGYVVTSQSRQTLN